jgi:hypothetical protein
VNLRCDSDLWLAQFGQDDLSTLAALASLQAVMSSLQICAAGVAGHAVD